MAIRERPYGSFHVGTLPVGCKHCEKGGKMVLFATGLCPFSCYYCPISSEKKGKDVVFADEMHVSRDADILEEARAIDATGAGVTGGDPLAAVDRTVRYIKLLKREFGGDFHIHLYTMSADAVKVARLGSAGLDEIRFHPPARAWPRMERSAYPLAVAQAEDSGMDVGLEVPLVPDLYSDLAELISWAQSHDLDFVNLNEMEFSETNRVAMHKRGYRVGRGKAYGARGSDRAARAIISRKWSIPVHYCTAAYKDSWQLRERIKRRAKNVARPWEIVTDDGTLIKGIIESDDLQGLLRRLKSFRVPGNLVWLNHSRHRLEIAPSILEELAPRLAARSFIIEEYPTADHLEVERRMLNHPS